MYRKKLVVVEFVFLFECFFRDSFGRVYNKHVGTATIRTIRYRLKRTESITPFRQCSLAKFTVVVVRISFYKLRVKILFAPFVFLVIFSIWFNNFIKPHQEGFRKCFLKSTIGEVKLLSLYNAVLHKSKSTTAHE